MTQRAVYYDFCKDRSGEHPRRVLHAFTGTLVSDDYTGSLSNHALHRRGVVAAFCMTHARRKLFEAHALNGSEIAAQAVTLLIARLDETEREARELDPDARHVVRQLRSKLIADALRAWLTSKRQTLARRAAPPRRSTIR